jgi:hypothetical protein
MAGERVRPPADPIDAMLAIARQDDAGVHHLRHYGAAGLPGIAWARSARGALIPAWGWK